MILHVVICQLLRLILVDARFPGPDQLINSKAKKTGDPRTGVLKKRSRDTLVQFCGGALLVRSLMVRLLRHLWKQPPKALATHLMCNCAHNFEAYFASFVHICAHNCEAHFATFVHTCAKKCHPRHKCAQMCPNMHECAQTGAHTIAHNCAHNCVHNCVTKAVGCLAQKVGQKVHHQELHKKRNSTK